MSSTLDGESLWSLDSSFAVFIVSLSDESLDGTVLVCHFHAETCISDDGDFFISYDDEHDDEEERQFFNIYVIIEKKPLN